MPILMAQRRPISAACLSLIHIFAAMSRKLCGCTERVVISFLDLYRKIEQTTRELGLRVPCREEMLELAGELAELASAADMKIQACAEALNMTDVGIEAGSCIDRDLIERLTGREIDVYKRPCPCCGKSMYGNIAKAQSKEKKTRSY